MITSNAKTSAVVVNAPRPLTKEQREAIRAECASNLPADVGVIVLDPGFVIAAVGDAGLAGDLVVGEAQQDETQHLILAELQRLRADIAQQVELVNAVGMKIIAA